MPSPSTAPRRRTWIDRVAHVAFTFIVMNASAVEALFAAIFGKKVWRP